MIDDTPEFGALRQLDSVGRGRISLRTLVTVRWITLVCQIATILVVHYLLGFAIPMQIALGIIAFSALVNIIIHFQHPGAARLDDRDTMTLLAYDTIQLGALLFITGGLHNPFSFMLLAPVTVGASILSRSGTAALCGIATATATVLAIWHLPLPWDESALALPALYIVAVWLSLVLSILFIAAYTWSVSEEGRRMNDALAAAQSALAREQRLLAVVALAAAAAHELGSPLGTIAVVAKELTRDLPPDSPFAEDARLLLSETDRCRMILASLTGRPSAAREDPFDKVPAGALAEMASAPHAVSGIDLLYETLGDSLDQPVLAARPEILQGIGNIVQNAVQFAQSRVSVTTSWDHHRLLIDIVDDGPGFPAHVLSRLGEPYLSSRASKENHMGLGLFIAETLLQRTGAMLAFSNGRDGGARARISWPRDIFDFEMPEPGWSPSAISRR